MIKSRKRKPIYMHIKEKIKQDNMWTINVNWKLLNIKDKDDEFVL